MGFLNSIMNLFLNFDSIQFQIYQTIAFYFLDFEYLCFYFNDLKENNFQEFNYLYGKEREPDELAYCQLSKNEKKQILN